MSRCVCWLVPVPNFNPRHISSNIENRHYPDNNNNNNNTNYHNNITYLTTIAVVTVGRFALHAFEATRLTTTTATATATATATTAKMVLVQHSSQQPPDY